MRLHTGLTFARDRIRRLETWGGILVFAWLWDLLRPGPRGGGHGGDGFLVAVLLGAVLLLLAPLPWQWTADARPAAGFARGLVQALAWNLAVVAGALALLPAPWREGMPPGHGMMGGPALPGPMPFHPGPVRSFVLGLATVAFGTLLGRILADRDGQRLRADQAERFAREAQTRALQAQMNPHVLFNVISGLAELAREDPGATEEALVQLAELMRRLLEHAGASAAPLAQERALVERLLALEQFRLGPRLQVAWAWDRSLEALRVPPLLLQPLVENAIKHGIAPWRAGGELEIGLAGTPDALRLWVANTGAPFREGGPDGVGLANLRQRLALMPGSPGAFSLRAEAGRTLAELRIRPAEAGHG